MNADLDGILLIDKPVGQTSHQAVELVRRILGTRRAGHTGTLDPDATGLLVVCIGKALRLVEFMEPLSKEYITTVRLGRETDTLDASGKTLSEAPVPAFTREELLRVLEPFRGEISQRPPAISAIRVGGKRSYALARHGIDVPLPERRIRIHALDLLDWTTPKMTLKISCSKGTYIRSLARDLGKALGCGGCVDELRRTAVGNFTVDQAIRIGHDRREELQARLMDLESGLDHLPIVDVDGAAAMEFGQGKAVALSSSVIGTVRIHCQTAFLGIGEATAEGSVRPKKVLFRVNSLNAIDFPKMI